MSLEKLLSDYEEFQVILSKLDNSWKLNETLNLVEFKTDNKICISFLKEINSLADRFEIYCNPFTADCNEIIEDLESSHIGIEDIDSVSIQLEKDIQFTVLDFYFFDREFALKSTQEVNSKLDSKLQIGIPDIEYTETETIQFLPLKSELDLNGIQRIKINEITQENIKFYLSNNKRDKHSYYYNPYSFIISEGEGEENSDFIDLIRRFFYLTMLDCLSDKKSQKGFLIRGEKNISILKNRDFATNNYYSFVDIFYFLISAKRFTEKYIIIKKVFSIYIIDDENISALDGKLNNIWKTITHYYNHYIEESLEDFFETKDKLLKEAMNASKIIYEQTDKLYTTIIASLLSLVIVFITTLYRSMTTLTVSYFVTLLILFISFSVVYYLLMSSSAKQRYKMTNAQFTYFMDEVSLMEESESDKLRETYLLGPYEILTDTLNNLKTVLISINVFIFLSFLVFIIVKYDICFLK
ncbi:hypothetical protein [Virgibacillus halodenitrificans]|uniref:Uncharacterized protein n=1 Tax=Virgibacillus halodenitrificans TaxID=1482 RepID=A0ABR7VN16_VIRHA|nr:hypothetical protein [Virgibacillus halodenitrificans]MBD1223306.1 hypothetical protein [Virgibacillus halodenitrificans]